MCVCVCGECVILMKEIEIECVSTCVNSKLCLLVVKDTRAYCHLYLIFVWFASCMCIAPLQGQNCIHPPICALLYCDGDGYNFELRVAGL